MKRILASLGIAALGFAPLIVSAHEHDVFKIGSKQYQFVVGSLNEPVAVDDKSGVELSITSGQSEPAAGLEKTLKVEISAGDKKKVLDLVPAFGKPGSYTAPFYPTVQTTYSYRVFGTVDNLPVDVSFTCNPAGHPQEPENKTEVKLSDSVTRVSKAGAFGCPVAKADLGFPEPSKTIYELGQSSSGPSRSSGGSGRGGLSVAALALSVIALVSSFALRSKTKVS